MPDYNMYIAWKLGQGFDPCPDSLPDGLEDLQARAEYINEIDAPLVNADAGASGDAIGKAITNRITDMVAGSTSWKGDLDDVSVASIALRLWAGCIMAAKTIALDTLDGPNTSESRAEAFKDINELAKRDTVFRAGVEVAPIFKHIRGNDVSYDGVPEESPVRRYLNDEPASQAE